MSKYFLLIVLFFGAENSWSVETNACNKKVGEAMKTSANHRCQLKSQSKSDRIVWSEKEVGFNAELQSMTAAFYFTCKAGGEYLAILKFTTDGQCTLSPPIIAHTSELQGHKRVSDTN